MELWELYDEHGEPLGVVHQRGAPLLPGQYHPVTGIFTVNSKGFVLLTRRHPDKSNGGCWEVTGGCIRAGEDPLTAAKRELWEETGIRAETLLPLGRDLTILPGDPVVCWSYVLRRDMAVKQLTLQKNEVTDARWVSPDLLEPLYGAGGLEPMTGWLWRKYRDRILFCPESWENL